MLTETEFAGLRLLSYFAGSGFNGPRPGSNAWPLLDADTPFGEVEGETIDALQRKGLLDAVPYTARIPRVVSADMDGESLDIDLDHRWFVNEAGRRALAEQAGGERP